MQFYLFFITFLMQLCGSDLIIHSQTHTHTHTHTHSHAEREIERETEPDIVVTCNSAAFKTLTDKTSKLLWLALSVVKWEGTGTGMGAWLHVVVAAKGAHSKLAMLSIAVATGCGCVRGACNRNWFSRTFCACSLKCHKARQMLD